MKRVNIEEKSRILNEFTQKNQNRSFTRQELLTELKNLGFNTNVIGVMIPKLFEFEEIVGNSRLYTCPKNPIYKGLIKNCYDKCNSYNTNKTAKKTITLVELNEESAIAFLKKLGYCIKKPIGFNEEEFARMNPELYKKFTKFEVV